MGLVHGYGSFEIPGQSAVQSMLIVFNLGILGDFNLDEMDGPSKTATGSRSEAAAASSNPEDNEYYYVVRVLFVVVVFGVTVTLMNTYIAAISSSFEFACQRMEMEFQSH